MMVGSRSNSKKISTYVGPGGMVPSSTPEDSRFKTRFHQRFVLYHVFVFMCVGPARECSDRALTRQPLISTFIDLSSAAAPTRVNKVLLYKCYP
ncbi:hypothetical protein AVEN_127019-1 [Araneus ventricosus]|uniref:Uncharacterized protein n=1 Tax=Araneus ventricosus TaxID=182803 RepID=A0A4Y2C3M0_ARAVE|nr:hypothetical protein AVEN_127019-1 [Araneus ventricosus]